jgi:hypothetical protein
VRTRLDSRRASFGMRKLWCALAARMGYGIVAVVIGLGAAVAAILMHTGPAGGATHADSVRPANAIAALSTQAGPSVLYVQMARRGWLSRADRRGRATLTLKGVSRAMLFFSDRPERVAGQTATRSFVAGWRRAFGNDPPNAALSVLRRGTGRDVALELLRRPTYNARTATLTYRIRRLDEADAGLFPSRFNHASLFIDSVPSSGYVVKVMLADGRSESVRLGDIRDRMVIAVRTSDGGIELQTQAVNPPDGYFHFTNYSGEQIVVTISSSAQPDVPLASSTLSLGLTWRYRSGP